MLVASKQMKDTSVLSKQRKMIARMYTYLRHEK